MFSVLIVEDDPSIRDNVADLLEASGYAPIKAANGKEGIEQALHHAPDLIVCDVMMPECDGHDVLRAVRSDSALAATPFIFLTAKSTREDLREGMDGGADDYVTKPFRAADLLNAIETRLTRRHAIEEQQEQRLERLRRTISAILPHELRTPLVGIEGYTQLLMEDWDDLDGEVARGLLGEVLSSSNRLKRLVENYILYARLAAGMPVEESGPAPAREVIHMQAQERASDHDREGDLQLAVDHGQIDANPVFFAKLVHELIDNAFQFSEDGAPVRVEGQAGVGGYELVIRDAGRGMTPEQVQQIGAFVQFDRGEFEQQGSGLGLTIARKIARHHGGSVEVQSAAGDGTTVTVRLPLVESVAPGVGDNAASSDRPSDRSVTVA